jgi:chromosome segregation ATPase
VLEGTATVNQSAAYKSIQEQAAEALAADHARMFEVERSAAESEKQRAEHDLQTLVDEESVIKGRLHRLDVAAGPAEQPIPDPQPQTADAAANRARAAAQSVSMAEHRDAMQRALQDNRRNQDLKHAEVQRYDLQLRNLQNTHAVVLAMQSPQPVGVSRAMVVALGFMLGGLLALLAPLVIEFVGRVQLKAAAEDRERVSRQGEVPDAHRQSGA